MFLDYRSRNERQGLIDPLHLRDGQEAGEL
jgi:hypothetical protein